jgi:broad specificity phosphatase PhoE
LSSITRRRTLFLLGAFAIVALALGIAYRVRPRGGSGRPEWILLVRHAEQAVGEGDVPLSAAGRERVLALIAALRDVGVDAIYSTGPRRNQETARAVAEALGLLVTVQGGEAGSRERLGELRERLRSGRHAGERVLLVEHSDTIPVLLRGLGIESPPERAGYSELYLVPLPAAGGPPSVVILHFGAPEPPRPEH